jgi:hypothetical protein
MSASSQDKTGSSEESGVADVRHVREKIAAQYGGDMRRHVADTERLVAPLLETLGLKQGVPPKSDERRSGTEG